MLHTMDDDGHMAWNCVQCDNANTAHISDVQISLLPGSPDHRKTVRLPACECGAQTYLKVDFTEQELIPPLIVRNPDGTIKSVEIRGAPNFTHIDYQLLRSLIPHPDRPGEALESFTLLIKDVRQHPAIELHQKLHALLHSKPAPSNQPQADDILQNFGG